MYFGHGVGTALGLFEHLGVDGGQVVCGHSGDASGFIVDHCQSGWACSGALVVGLDFVQRCIGGGDQGLHFGSVVGSALGLFEHLGVDGGQVVCGHTRDASGLVVVHRQSGWACSVALVVGFDLVQGSASVGQGLYFAVLVGVGFFRCFHPRVDRSQVVCAHPGDAGFFVVIDRWGRVGAAVVSVAGNPLQRRRLFTCPNQCDDIGLQIGDRLLGGGRLRPFHDLRLLGLGQGCCGGRCATSGQGDAFGNLGKHGCSVLAGRGVYA